MKNLVAIFACLFLTALCLNFCARKSPGVSEGRNPSEAGASLRLFAMARTFPDGKFHTEKYEAAVLQANLEAKLRGTGSGNIWQSLGPKNIGGRALCLAFHPQDSNILFVGTASGGLWKSTSGGKGYTAWTYIETSFPLLGVSAVAINPLNANEMYIGTGEVYNVENSMPNVAIRVTRGSYGIGLLKSSDGGATWQKSLDWDYSQLRGVQDIKINPLRPATVFAATTEGIFRTWNSGANWHRISTLRMAVDLEIHPLDTNIVFATHGSLSDTDVSGVYRSTNAGTTFAKLAGGLPATFTGKALISICAADPAVVWASVGNDFNQEGLYVSKTGGNTWTKKSTQNVASYQGWYSHDVSVRPDNPEEAVWVGIEAFKSTNGGTNWTKTSTWSAWTFGQVPVGGPEGPPNYAHADIHRAYHDPKNFSKVWLVTDGGVFVSHNGGSTWEGRNGSLQCTQFYANLGNSTTNPALCIGGMQDNSTAIYTGDDAWTRVLGGDGECAAVDPSNDQTMYGSYQYLSMQKSEDGGQSWFGCSPDDSGDPTACFNGPFEIAPSDPQQLYAGGARLWRSFDGAQTWNDPLGDMPDFGNAILTIAVCPTDPELIYFSTAPTQNDEIHVFKSTDGGATIAPMTGLPNRLCMDIAFHPTETETAYAVFSGFGNHPVWRTLNGGTTWQSVSSGLPDIPANTVLVDPNCPQQVYIGNDLGVWLSRDGGTSWENFSLGAPRGMLAMHLSISPADKKLRVATYGLGVWQTDLAECVPSSGANDLASEEMIALRISPNPADERAKVVVKNPGVLSGAIFRLFDASGREVLGGGFPRRIGQVAVGGFEMEMDLGGMVPGFYGLVLEGKFSGKGAAFRRSLVFLKN